MNIYVGGLGWCKGKEVKGGGLSIDTGGCYGVEKGPFVMDGRAYVSDRVQNLARESKEVKDFVDRRKRWGAGGSSEGMWWNDKLIRAEATENGVDIDARGY